MIRPYILKETNWKTVQNTDYQLAVLPWGATEAHNYHLPYGTDIYEADTICEKAAEITWNKGCKVIVLPTIPFGVNTGQTDIKLDINMMPSTQMALLSDITQNLSNHNITKLLLVNSHGGNDFKPIIREVNAKFPNMTMVLADWFRSLPKEKYFDENGDHADEMETSLMLYWLPDLVLPLDEAGEGKSKIFSVNEINEDWVWAERKWNEVTPDTGIGNPKKATREKGKIYFEAVTKKLAALMINLANTPLNKFYKYSS